MNKDTIHKELYDPISHYSRGILFVDEEKFRFIAHRVPYLELNGKTWKSEQAFTNDYRRMVARKYSG